MRNETVRMVSQLTHGSAHECERILSILFFHHPGLYKQRDTQVSRCMIAALIMGYVPLKYACRKLRSMGFHPHVVGPVLAQIEKQPNHFQLWQPTTVPFSFVAALPLLHITGLPVDCTTRDVYLVVSSHEGYRGMASGDSPGFLVVFCWWKDLSTATTMRDKIRRVRFDTLSAASADVELHERWNLAKPPPKIVDLP